MKVQHLHRGSSAGVPCGIEGPDNSSRLCIKLEHDRQVLRVHIISAHNLPGADWNGLSDPFIKIYMLPEKSKNSRRKTEVKMRTLNPVFNETLLVCHYLLPILTFDALINFM